MAIKIKRHNLNKKRDLIGFIQVKAGNYKERLQKSMEKLDQNKGQLLQYAKENPLYLFIYSLTSGNHDENVFLGLRYFLDIGVAHFKQFQTSSSEITVRLGKKEYVLPSTDDLGGISIYGWRTLYSVAQILRDEEAEDFLLGIRKLISDKDPSEHAHMEAWSNYFFALKNGDTDARKKSESLIIKTAQTDKTHVQGNPKKVVYIVGRGEGFRQTNVPIVELYEFAILKEEDLFNERLSEYLKDRKQMILKRKDEEEPYSWVFIDTLACCAYAYDAGINIKVESEYISAWVFQGKWKSQEIIL